MRQPSLRPLLAAGVLGLALTAGCTRCACRSGTTRAAAVVPAVPTPRPLVVGTPLLAVASADPQPVAAVPAPMAPVEDAAPLVPPTVPDPASATANASPTPDQNV